MDEAEFNPKDEEKCRGLLGSPSLPIESAGLRPCPHCGYCPTCGRPQNVPYCPPFPYNPWYSGTWCSGGTGGVNTSV